MAPAHMGITYLTQNIMSSLMDPHARVSSIALFQVFQQKQEHT